MPFRSDRSATLLVSITKPLSKKRRAFASPWLRKWRRMPTKKIGSRAGKRMPSPMRT